MNDKAIPEDDILLDRLVDGELDENARRSLLVRIEGEPDGWRRCALAFLEAQSWTRELRRFVREPATKPALHVVRPPVKPAWRLGIWSTAFSMAASFLMAFALGISWRSGGGVSSQTPHIAGVSGAPSAVPGGSATDPQIAAVGPEQKGGVWGDVRFVGLGPDGAQWAVTVPVSEGPFDPDWLSETPPPIPEQVQRELVRSGRQFRQQRQIWPIELGNGRTVVVPFDQIEVSPVNHRTY